MFMIRLTKSVIYDEIEDRYYVKSFTTGENYIVNSLKDSLKDKNHWFCTCKGYAYNKKNPKTCKHVSRIKIIDEIRLKKLCSY